MDSHRWQQIKALLAECLELPPSWRSAALDRLCGDDDALRAELESLIDAAESEGLGESPTTRRRGIPPRNSDRRSR